MSNCLARAAALASLVAVLSVGALPAKAQTLPDAAGTAVTVTTLTEGFLTGIARAGDRVVAVGEFGGVLLSDDEGKSWRQAASVPTRVPLTSVNFLDGDVGFAVGHDSVILKTTDGGETWTEVYSDPEAELPLFTVQIESAEIVRAFGAFGAALETRDGGATWQTRDLQPGQPFEEHLNQAFKGEGQMRFVAAEGGIVYKSSDGGQTYQRIETPYEGSYWGGLSLKSGAVLVYGMRGNVWRSEDVGATWTEVPSGTDESFSGGAELDDGTVVLVGLGGAIARSTDGGLSFTAETRPDRAAFSDVAVAGNTLLLVGNHGIIQEEVGG